MLQVLVIAIIYFVLHSASDFHVHLHPHCLLSLKSFWYISRKEQDNVIHLMKNWAQLKDHQYQKLRFLYLWLTKEQKVSLAGFFSGHGVRIYIGMGWRIPPESVIPEVSSENTLSCAIQISSQVLLHWFRLVFSSKNIKSTILNQTQEFKEAYFQWLAGTPLMAGLSFQPAASIRLN